MNLGLAQKRDFDKWLNYLESRFPGSRRRILSIAQSRTPNTLGQNEAATPQPPPTKPWYTQIAEAAAAVIPTYINYKTQKKVLDVQMKRAEQGLPPMQEEYYRPAMEAPATTIRHEVAPQFSTEQTNMLWIFGGFALLMLFLMMNRDDD